MHLPSSFSTSFGALLWRALTKARRASVGDTIQLIPLGKEHSRGKSRSWRAPCAIYSINQIRHNKICGSFLPPCNTTFPKEAGSLTSTAKRNRNNCRLLPPLSQKVTMPFNIGNICLLDSMGIGYTEENAICLLVFITVIWYLPLINTKAIDKQTKCF